jgi:hypothetical protein
MNVERDTSHERAEQALKTLNARRQQLAGMLAAPGTWRVTNAMRKVTIDLNAVDEEIALTRAALMPMRQQHVQVLQQVYAEPIRDAAARARVALLEAEAACGEINAMRASLREAGGEARDIAAAKLLMPLRQLLRPIAGDDH